MKKVKEKLSYLWKDLYSGHWIPEEIMQGILAETLNAWFAGNFATISNRLSNHSLLVCKNSSFHIAVKWVST